MWESISLTRPGSAGWRAGRKVRVFITSQHTKNIYVTIKSVKKGGAKGCLFKASFIFIFKSSLSCVVFVQVSPRHGIN